MTAEYAEVWCQDCDHPADGADALCTLHRRLNELRKPVLLNDFDRILIRMALEADAQRYAEASVGQEDEPEFIGRHRKSMGEMANEFRRLARIMGQRHAEARW